MFSAVVWGLLMDRALFFQNRLIIAHRAAAPAELTVLNDPAGVPCADGMGCIGKAEAVQHGIPAACIGGKAIGLQKFYAVIQLPGIACVAAEIQLARGPIAFAG